jgi:hypothetical protein
LYRSVTLVALVSLLPVGASAHSFALSPGDVSVTTLVGLDVQYCCVAAGLAAAFSADVRLEMKNAFLGVAFEGDVSTRPLQLQPGLIAGWNYEHGVMTYISPFLNIGAVRRDGTWTPAVGVGVDLKGGLREIHGVYRLSILKLEIGSPVRIHTAIGVGFGAVF